MEKKDMELQIKEMTDEKDINQFIVTQLIDRY
jgi:hypothetical protein